MNEYQERPTQEKRILDLLRERGKDGAYVFEFMTPQPKGLGIAQYGARIWSLRKKGLNIMNTEAGHFVLLEKDQLSLI
jgi:hypothetical protein